jgi:predicted nuclease of predicted toxin-antitoxin system
MRLLADENIPLAAIDLLRKRGHDVLAVSEIAPSICDEDVLLMAKDEGRILLTFDKDFGELAFSSRPGPYAIAQAGQIVPASGQTIASLQASADRGAGRIFQALLPMAPGF